MDELCRFSWLNWQMVDISRVTVVGTPGVSDLFQILRDGKPRTRTELSSITGLARSTVALRIDSLTRLGLVGAADDATSTGGRPSSQVGLSSKRVVLGVDIGASHARVALTDVSGKQLGEEASAIEVREGPEVVLDWVIAAGRRVLEACDRSVDDLLAVGIGLPGPVEHATGRPINPPIMPGWNRFDVAGWLEQGFSRPVLVDNDVNIMALGERALAWPEVDHLMFVKVATGIGAGIISGGVLQRGATGIAGDLGHVQVARGAGVVCQCGNEGCLEAIASGSALARELSEGSRSVSGSQEVAELVELGDAEALRLVRQAGRDLGEVLTMCVSLNNPSVIVIGGSLALAGEHLLAGVREVVYRRSMPLAAQNLHVTQSAAGVNAAILGASMLAIQFALSPENIEAMVLELDDQLA